MSDHRPWAREAIRIIEADFQRSADTHLIPLALPGLPGIELYFKDESSHPTGSLKHRLARSLFLYALCNGWLKPGAPVIEASSGSTAISEAYFARLLGLPFIAVMPATTSKEKIAQIAFYGGKSHLVQDPTQIYAESERLAQEGGYLDIRPCRGILRGRGGSGRRQFASAATAPQAVASSYTLALFDRRGTTLGRWQPGHRQTARLDLVD